MTSAVLLYGDVFTHYNVTAFYQTVKALKKKKTTCVYSCAFQKPGFSVH